MVPPQIGFSSQNRKTKAAPAPSSGTGARNAMQPEGGVGEQGQREHAEDAARP